MTKFPSRDGRHWRMCEEEVRTKADETRDPRCAAIMLRIAADYARLAKYADDKTAFDSLMTRTAADYDHLLQVSDGWRDH